ncbi:hypothetical protein AAZV13_08G019400 [Glycine max]
MTNHHTRESIKFLESLIHPKNVEDLQRTKTDIENNVSKILELIKNKSHSTKGTELVGLVEDLYQKQQSLNALYDRVTEEFEKEVSRRRIKKSAMSFSDSDSEYFSPEEVDGIKRKSEKERHIVSDLDTLKQESDYKIKATTKFEEQLTSLTKEVESLSQQKKNLELQVESQTHEVEHLTLKNIDLYDQVSDLQTQLNNSESQAKSNVADLMAKINELELETKSLQTQKNEMGEKVECDKKEASTQREDLMEQLSVMQQRLDSIENEKKELQAEMERQREQISQDFVQIENLKNILAEIRSDEHNMVEEKEGFLKKLKELELNLESQNNQKNELEEKLRDTSYEVKQLANENKALQDRNHELRTTMTQKGEEISIFMKEQENHKNGASMEVMSLKAKLNGMRLELDTMHEQKNKLEQQNERSQKEYAESLAKVENLNTNLETQIDDQAKMIERLNEENKQAKIVYSKLKLIQVTAERKMNELAEEFRRKMEDNIRLLHQRIHVAEQLNNENKNSCKVTKQRYEDENKNLGLKIASYREETTTRVPIRFELVAQNSLDLVVEKVEEHTSRVTRMRCKVEFVKDWMKERNGEVKELREKVDCLRELLNKKEEQELVLRENMWKLEENVSKEGGEKLNLKKQVSQLEKKVGKLEKILKEKDEELAGGNGHREHENCKYVAQMESGARSSSSSSVSALSFLFYERQGTFSAYNNMLSICLSCIELKSFSLVTSFLSSAPAFTIFFSTLTASDSIESTSFASELSFCFDSLFVCCCTRPVYHHLGGDTEDV